MTLHARRRGALDWRARAPVLFRASGASALIVFHTPAVAETRPYVVGVGRAAGLAAGHAALAVLDLGREGGGGIGDGLMLLLRAA